jgi:hypothetical protein
MVTPIYYLKINSSWKGSYSIAEQQTGQNIIAHMLKFCKPSVKRQPTITQEY